MRKGELTDASFRPLLLTLLYLLLLLLLLLRLRLLAVLFILLWSVAGSSFSLAPLYRPTMANQLDLPYPLRT